MTEEELKQLVTDAVDGLPQDYQEKILDLILDFIRLLRSHPDREKAMTEYHHEVSRILKTDIPT